MANHYIVLSALILDVVVGDPRRFPHPVRMMGAYIVYAERFLRGHMRNMRFAGTVLTLSLIAVSWCVPFVLSNIPKGIGVVLSVYLIYTTISLKDLKDESMDVCMALEANDIEKAREKVAMIVGRDTKAMDREEIIRATIETVAENTVDGVLSPMFYAFIGGAPLAAAFKAVSTLDSMVGYKNEKYRDFGYASAKLDDALNYIPARVSVVFMAMAAFLVGARAVDCFKIGIRDGRKNPSPNSGYPEAAVAGALGLRLGGMNYYGGTPVMKDIIGDGKMSFETRHIRQCIRMSYVTSMLMVLTGVVLWALV